MQVQIELTNACNAYCIMCPHRLTKRPIKHMRLYLIQNIVNEVKAMSIATRELPMCISGIGEFTLHPHFFEAIEICSEVPFAFASNVQELDEFKQDCIIKNKFTVCTLSLDAFTKETFEKMRAGLSYDKVMKNILSFLDKLRKVDRFWDVVYIQFVVTSLNKDEIPAFMDYWIKQIGVLEGVKISFKPICPWPNKEANSLWPSPNVKIVEHPKVVWGYYDRPFKFRDSGNGCSMAFDWAQVLSDGTFSFCCLNDEDVYGIGNLYDNTLEELLNSEKMSGYRKLFKEKRYDEIPFCRDCV